MDGLASPRGRTIGLAYAGSALALTSVPLIAPSLPTIQAALGAGPATIGLFTTLYALPAVMLAAPFGLLVDKIGRKAVFVLAAATFGFAGLGLFLSRSLPVTLALRTCQGVAFAALFPVTLTMVGDVTPAGDHVREQARRTVFIGVAESIAPLAGGLLVLVGPFVPFLLQGSGLILAACGVALLPRSKPMPRRLGTARNVITLFHSRTSRGVQISGLVRFFVRYFVFAYGAVLLATKGIGPATIGVCFMVLSVTGLSAAVAMRRGLHRYASSKLFKLGFLVPAAGLILLAIGQTTGLVFIAMAMIGIGDGVLAVLTNAYIMVLTTMNDRGTYVALTVAVRNLGKVIAPTLAGVLLAFAPLSYIFAAFGLITGLAPGLLRGFLSELDGTGTGRISETPAG